jgi:tetratricopeptide (TPR) repeat protein
MATAYIAKGEIENAINSYGKALERESASPNLKTDAYILYPLLIVENKLTNLYQSANSVLDEHQERLMFPVDHFRWHAAKAIISTESGNNERAAEHAAQAFDAAQIKKSGFRFHQNLGLVGKEYKGVVNELRAIQA